MRWQGGRRSTNVSDRRGMGGGLLPIGGGLGLVITIVALLMGINPGDVIQGNAPATQERQPGVADDSMEAKVSVVLADTEDTWNQIFAQSNQNYPEPQLVLFSGMVQSACGMAQSAVGPFYCPNDQNVYIDLSFYDELRKRFGAEGDFAQAYVIAHEVGHHVQNITGQLGNPGARDTGPTSQAVRVELQADCYAGIWANRSRGGKNIQLEEGDIEEALNAAAAIGDDRLQRQTQGQVVPESFTHGTSEQRARWFRTGFQTGDVRQCDTHRASTL
jgi:uncharacterized protein